MLIGFGALAQRRLYGKHVAQLLHQLLQPDNTAHADRPACSTSSTHSVVYDLGAR